MKHFNVFQWFKELNKRRPFNSEVNIEWKDAPVANENDGKAQKTTSRFVHQGLPLEKTLEEIKERVIKEYEAL